MSIRNKITPICEYGCGQLATHQFKNGKWCCKSNHAQCSSTGKKISDYHKGRLKGVGIKTKAILLDSNDSILCDYGCNELAKYKFKGGKYCCSKIASKCYYIRKQRSILKSQWAKDNPNIFAGKNNPNYGNKMSDESKNRISIANSKHWEDLDYRKNFTVKIKRYYKENGHPMTGKKLSNAHKKLISERMKNNIFNKGRVHTDEFKRKVSEGLKKYYFENPDAIRRGKDNPLYGKIGTFYGRKHS